MENKHLIVPKGYTLSITSWENDADYYATNDYTVDNKELAKEILDFCNMCRSGSNNQTTVGNGHAQERKNIIIEFFKTHPLISEHLDVDINKDGFIMDAFYDLAFYLFGSSEFYDCRVFDSAVVMYSPTDVYVEKVSF